MHFFYCSNINEKTLNREESHHCTKVLRLKAHDEIALIDGKGTYAEAKLTYLSDKKTLFEITKIKEKHNPLNHYLHMAVAPTKNINRFEWFIEKATEIGIAEITPLLTENTERKVIKTERLEKVILAACKQSQKAYFPKLNEMVSFDKFIDRQKLRTTTKTIAHCYEADKMPLQQLNSLKDILICIGPEGDFTPSEIDMARKNELVYHFGILMI